MMDHDRPQLVADMLDYIGHRHIDRLTTRPNKGRDSHIVMILPLRPELRLMPIGPPQEFVTKRYRHEYTLCPQEPPRADPVQTLGRCLLDAFSWKKIGRASCRERVEVEGGGAGVGTSVRDGR